MIIGICGFISSGKDTVADYLVNYHEFRRVSFAGALKDAISCVFGWDRNMLEGRTKTSREWREHPDLWWSQRLGQNITPRGVLQQWGTEVCRAAFHDDIWIASLENQLRTSVDNVVISDCRFPNEIENMISDLYQIITIRIKRYINTIRQEIIIAGFTVRKIINNLFSFNMWKWSWTHFKHSIVYRKNII
jgi:hypothetical protein